MWELKSKNQEKIHVSLEPLLLQNGPRAIPKSTRGVPEVALSPWGSVHLSCTSAGVQDPCQGDEDRALGGHSHEKLKAFGELTSLEKQSRRRVAISSHSQRRPQRMIQRAGPVQRVKRNHI